MMYGIYAGMLFALSLNPRVSDVLRGALGFAVLGAYVWIAWLAARRMKRFAKSPWLKSRWNRLSPFCKVFPVFMMVISLSLFFWGVLTEPGPPWWLSHYTDLSPGLNGPKELAVLINFPAFFLIVRYLVLLVALPLFALMPFLGYAVLPLLYPLELLAANAGMWLYWYLVAVVLARVFPQLDQMVLAINPGLARPSTTSPGPPNRDDMSKADEPAAPEGVPRAPFATAKPAGLAPLPGSNYQQNRLVNVEAPPVPNRSYPLCPPPPGVVRKRLAFMGSTLALAVPIASIFYLLRLVWLAIASSIFFGLAGVFSFFGRNLPVGACPFCGGLIERYNPVRPEPVRCEHCSEISKLENNRFSAYDPNAVAETPIFRSPLFENGVWPNGCVLCGAPPARFDDAKAVRHTAHLATPTVMLYLPDPAARATGVPYCEHHRDAVQVLPPETWRAWYPWEYLPGMAVRMEQRRKAFLMWRSLPMMRRYLEANRRAKSAVSSGYLEPNLFQKVISRMFGKIES